MIALAVLPENFNEILNHPRTDESLTVEKLTEAVEIAALSGDIYVFVPDFIHPKNSWRAPWTLIRVDYLAKNFDFDTLFPTNWFDITPK